jgi:hypothetical protein
MKSIFLLFSTLILSFQAPQKAAIERDNGLAPYQLGMNFSPKLGLKFVKKSGNNSEYKGEIHLKIGTLSTDEDISSSFYKGRLMAFGINIRDAARAKEFCRYLSSRYGKGIKDKDEYGTSDDEITTWSSSAVTIQTLVNKKTGATWIDFISENVKKRQIVDPTTKMPEI